MKNKAAFPSKYLQGQGLLNELPDLINIFGGKGFILTSPTVKEKILPVYECRILDEKIPVGIFRGECCEEELGRMETIIKEKKINVFIGMGGGKTIDTAKIAADRAGIPVIVIPTIVSTDAPCSGCAVLYSPQGTFEKVLYQKRNPAAVVVDMDIIADAPPRFLIAGMGDALSTWFEARSCDKTKSVNECGGIGTLTSLNLARLCYDTLLKYGAAAKADNEQKKVTPALNYIAEANTLLSGIGFESSGLATAHAIYNGMTVLPETHAYYHGEKVAFGVLTGLHMNGTTEEELETVYNFCESVGLPVTLAEIGITEPYMEKLLKAAEKSCAPGSSIHHETGVITPAKVIRAMVAADEYGRKRKKKG